MTENKTYLSKEKLEELKQELDFLKGTRRKEVAEQLELAKSFGDLTENAEYHQAREAQATMEGRIIELGELLRSVEIVAHHASDIVDVGTTVVVRREDESGEKHFEIVGSEEADTSAGKISLNSPLGRALMGKKEKEKFVFKTPTGKEINYKILRIE